MKEYVFSSDLYIGFKRIDETVNDIHILLEKIINQLLDPNSLDDRNDTIINIKKCIRWDNLVGSQALLRIEILFDDEVGVINFHYYHQAEQKDTIDISILEIVPIRVKNIDVVLITNDIDLSKLSGTDHLEKLSTESIKFYIKTENFRNDNNNDIEIIEKASPGDFINFSGSDKNLMS